ncbi:hypothetical protein L0337_09580 [candidate division KSB1 bacterium]|nr:hypothetical protein [candidate division KSB1 bacterium]
MSPDQEHQLNIWQPGGIVLSGIGLLTLSTPLFTSLAANALLIDLVAGGALLLTGMLGIFVGRRRAAK